MNNLIYNNEIILKPPDKGGGLAIIDKTYHRDKHVLTGHLKSNVYTEISGKA